MWIKRVIIKNVGRHRFLDLFLQRGLVGVFGFNGDGKSTIVDGIYACLTNDWGRFDGVKQDNVRDTIDPEEESSFTTIGEHGGVEFEVYRRLRKAESDKRKKGLRKDNELVVEGKTYDNDNDISHQLQTRLGVNFKLLGTHVFVAQREMFKFVSDTPGVRAATFQTLCGTEKAQQIVKAIEDQLEVDQDLLLDVEDNSDEINARIAARGVDLKAARDMLAEAKGRLLPKKKRLTAKLVVEKWQTRRRAVKEIKELKPSILSRKKDVSSANLRQAVADKELEANDAAYKRVKPKAEEARTALTRLAEYDCAREAKKNLTKRVADAKAAVAALGDQPTLHPEDGNREKLVEERGSVRAKYQENKTLLETFEADGVVKCPTCGTSVKELDKHLKQVKAAQPGLRNRGVELKELIEQIDARREARESWAKKKRAADSEVSKYEALLRASDVGEPPKGDSKTLQAVIDDFDRIERALADARKLASEATARLATAQARLDADLQRRADLRKTRDTNVVTSDELQQAQRRLKRHTAARVNVAAAQEKVAGLEAADAVDNEELTKLKVRLARNKKARQYVAKLKAIAGVMHRQALPQLVAQSNLQDMEADINKILDTFGSPFWVETAEDLTFTVHFPGEPPKPAGRLSVGQKGVLAMAFRPAISSLFDAEIGMMTLDEPTADMDERNRGFMTTALSQYAAQVRGQRQVIVITHAPELRPAFDQVVDLSVQGQK